jgi:hypothetical protein
VRQDYTHPFQGVQKKDTTSVPTFVFSSFENEVTRSRDWLERLTKCGAHNAEGSVVLLLVMGKKQKVRQRGIEPRPLAWKASMLTIAPLATVDARNL